MKTKVELYSIAAVILSLMTPTRSAASGICTAARFRDWQNMGCNRPYVGVGGPAESSCSPCNGMPRWWVSEPYEDLCLKDTPLSYRLSSGKEMDFTFYYRTRATLPRSDEVTALPTFNSFDVYPTVINCGTNASWGNNWNLSITIWDPTWENSWSSCGGGTYTCPPGYAPYSRGYQVFVWRPEGGINYFNVQSGQQNIYDPKSLMRLGSVTASQNYPVVAEQVGGSTVNNPPTADSDGIYWGNPGIGLTLTYPDGSQDVFGLTPFPVTDYARAYYYSSAGTSESRLLLTERIDPQGRVTRLGYEATAYTNFYQFSYNYTPLYYCLRLKYVVDPDQRTNTFVYCPASPSTPVDNPFQLAQIRDPYGRFVSIGNQFTGAPTRDTVGYITNVTDAAGLSSSFYYLGQNGWIDQLNTPYGKTSFCYYQVPDASQTVIDGYQQRAVYVSEPTGAQQLYLYYHNNPSEAGTDVAPTVPGQTFDDGTTGSFDPSLIHRNTYHWGRLQFEALSGNSAFNQDIANALGWEQVGNFISSSNYFSYALAALSRNDFNKAELKHWLLWSGDDASITESVSSERDPSPDAAGQTPGLRTWYNYSGKPSGEPELLGSDPQISCIARLLPGGTSQFTTYNYYPVTVLPGYPAGAGFVSDAESSYSKANGAVGELTNWFSYAGNSVDLVGISNSAGQWVAADYNNFHQISAITNALNQVTTLSWDDYNTHNLTGIRWPGGASLALNLFYSGQWPGFVQQAQFEPQGRTFTFNSYNFGLPTSTTDDRNVALASTWDGLNRLTSITFPDTTIISNVYTALDLTATKDRLGNWTEYVYDGLDHLTDITNANNGVTILDWCGCGSLKGILDPMKQLTSLSYDNQGNLTNIVFADTSTVSYQYDLAGRMTNVFDGLGRALHVAYNNQDLPTTVSSVYGAVQQVIYDAVNRPVIVTDADGVTVTNTYDGINDLLARTWQDGISESFGYATNGLVAYTNRDGKVTLYGRDTAGRLISATDADQEVTEFAYNSMDELTSLINGLSQPTTWQYDEYGLLTNKVDALGRDVERLSYNPDGWVTNRWTPEKGNTAYYYDGLGNLTNIVYPDSAISYTYDADSRLTNMVDASGTNSFAYTPVGQLQSETGPWPSDTITYTYVQRLRTALTLSQPSGPWQQEYNDDPAWRLTNILSPAGAFNYAYPSPTFPLPSSISLPNGAGIAYGYDALARLTQTILSNQWGHVLDGYAYLPDALGLRTNIVRDLGLTSSSVNVGYDNIGQITSWDASETNGTARMNEQFSFGFDSADNLQSRESEDLFQVFTVDGANELTNVTHSRAITATGALPAPASSVTVNGQAAQVYGDFTFASPGLPLHNGVNSFTNIAQNAYGILTTNIVTVNTPSSVNLFYDNNGNLTNDGVRAFGYNAENELTNITVAGQWRSDFIYDGLGRRRIVRDYAWQSGGWQETNEIHILYDGYLPIQERDANNTVLVTYTRGLDLGGSLWNAGGIGGLLARTDANGSTYYHSDGAGNITALMDTNELVVARYLYGPFGKLVGQWGRMANSNEMQFSSMPMHDGLSFYPFRAYEPNFQRWLNQDPIQEWGGINLYRAMNNNPVSWIDPFGLAGLEEEGGAEDGGGEDELENLQEGGGSLSPGYMGPGMHADNLMVQREWQLEQQDAQRVAQEEQQQAKQLELPMTNPRPENEGKTSGVLCDKKGNQFALTSGWNGPAQGIPRGTPGFDIVSRTHVEGHAAAMMRQQGMDQAQLYINNPAVCESCVQNLPSMLPPGGQLTVVLPNGATATFVGK